VIEMEGDREIVLQRMRERMFHISTDVRESNSDRQKSGDFNVGERVSQRDERNAGRDYRLQVWRFQQPEREGIADRK
jgi:hypothetical protein